MPHEETKELVLKFLEETYDPIFYYEDCGEDKFLGDENNKTCRFCGETGRDKFYKKAHIFPESMGNKHFFSHWECDGCNEAFGNGIENEFGKYILPLRIFQKIEGKNGYGKAGSERAGWSIEFVEELLTIQARQGFNIIQPLDDSHIKIEIARKSHIPAAVYKTFVKMGLSILPPQYVKQFQPTIEWIKSKDHSTPHVSPLRLWVTFVPGPRPFDRLTSFLMKKKESAAEVVFILCFGNYAYQTLIPHPVEAGRDILIPHFPTPYDFSESEFGPVQKFEIDMSSIKARTGDTESMIMRYESMKRLSRDEAVSMLKRIGKLPNDQA